MASSSRFSSLSLGYNAESAFAKRRKSGPRSCSALTNLPQRLAASCTASKHHILLTPFPTGDISFARDKVSNLQYRARRILEEPVVEKSDFRLFKKVQM